MINFVNDVVVGACIAIKRRFNEYVDDLMTGNFERCMPPTVIVMWFVVLPFVIKYMYDADPHSIFISVFWFFFVIFTLGSLMAVLATILIFAIGVLCLMAYMGLDILREIGQEHREHIEDGEE